LLDQTNFFAEAGGQEHDIGTIVSADSKADFTVIEVHNHHGYVLHVGHLKAGQLRVGQEVTCSYDEVSAESFRLLYS
jgi:alanyl-tRNA synthetase